MATFKFERVHPQFSKAGVLSLWFEDPRAEGKSHMVMDVREDSFEVVRVYRFGKRRRVVRRQEHFREIAAKALAIGALEADRWMEIDL